MLYTIAQVAGPLLLHAEIAGIDAAQIQIVVSDREVTRYTS